MGALRPERRPGWLHTGDLARQDADGYIYPSGRLKDTINRGGEKFGPIEIEKALATIRRSSDVAAAGVPDTEMGQRVGVAVVARAPLTLGELEPTAGSASPTSRFPSASCSSTHIPYSDTGKVVRRQLAALIAGES